MGQKRRFWRFGPMSALTPKATAIATGRTVALCQYRPSCIAANSALFDHLIGTDEGVKAGSVTGRNSPRGSQHGIEFSIDHFWTSELCASRSIEYCAAVCILTQNSAAEHGTPIETPPIEMACSCRMNAGISL